MIKIACWYQNAKQCLPAQASSSSSRLNWCHILRVKEYITHKRLASLYEVIQELWLKINSFLSIAIHLEICFSKANVQMCRCTCLSNKYSNIRVEGVTGNVTTFFFALNLLFGGADRQMAQPGPVSIFLKHPDSAWSYFFPARSTSTKHILIKTLY